jgi:hypothetical protein
VEESSQPCVQHSESALWRRGWCGVEAEITRLGHSELQLAMPLLSELELGENRQQT